MKQILFFILFSLALFSCTIDAPYAIDSNEGVKSKNISGLLINEVDTQGSPQDFIELINKSSTNLIILSNTWSLTDQKDANTTNKYHIPAQTIPPNGLIAFERVTHFTFGLSDSDPGVFLFNGTTLVDSLEWSGVHQHSTGRYPDGTASLRYNLTPSKGTANTQ